jgi:hypothetical protein
MPRKHTMHGDAAGARPTSRPTAGSPGAGGSVTVSDGGCPGERAPTRLMHPSAGRGRCLLRPYRWIVMSLHGLVVSAGCRVCVESASHARADDVALLAELSSGRWQARMWTTCQHRQSMLGAGWCAVPAMKRTGPRCPGLHRGGALGSWRQRAGDYLLAMWRIGAGGWPGPSWEHEPVAMPLATE